MAGEGGADLQPSPPTSSNASSDSDDEDDAKDAEQPSSPPVLGGPKHNGKSAAMRRLERQLGNHNQPAAKELVEGAPSVFAARPQAELPDGAHDFKSANFALITDNDEPHTLREAMGSVKERPI